MNPFKSKRKNEKRSWRGGITIIVPHSKPECEERLFKAPSQPYGAVRFVPRRTGQLTFYITEELAWAEGELTVEDTQSTRVSFHAHISWVANLTFAGMGLFMLALIYWAAKEEGKPALWPVIIFLTLMMFIIPVFWIWLRSHKQKSTLRDAVLKVLDAPPDTTYRRTVHLYIIGNIFVYTSVLWGWLILVFDHIGFNVFAATGAALLAGLVLAVYLHVLRYVAEYVIYRLVGRGQYDRALRTLMWLQWINLYWSFTTNLYPHARAKIIFEAGHYHVANDMYTRVLGLRPTNERSDYLQSYAIMAQIKWVLGDTARASVYFENVLADPIAARSSFVWPAAAQFYLETERPNKALWALGHAENTASLSTRLMPCYRPQLILAGSAWAYALQGHDEAARRVLADALQPSRERYDPGEAALHYYAAQTMRLIDEPNRARAHLNTALERDPDGHIGTLSRRLLAKLS